MPPCFVFLLLAVSAWHGFLCCVVMHGRVKATKPLSDDERAALAVKIGKYRALEAAALELVRSCDGTGQIMLICVLLS
jgi:hypothetical protein